MKKLENGLKIIFKRHQPEIGKDLLCIRLDLFIGIVQKKINFLIQKKKLLRDANFHKENGRRMYNSLSNQIDWLYSEYVKVCDYCNEVSLSKGAWLSQDIVVQTQKQID